MRVVTVAEENHGQIGIASTYENAVHFLVNTDWLSELTEVYRDGFDDTCPIVEDLGTEWLAELLGWSMEKFNEYFDGCFYLESEEVYEVA